MIKQNKKPLILIFLLLILVVEVVFLVRRMTLDKQAIQTLAGVINEKKVVDQSIQELNQQNLENFVTNKELLATTTKAKEQVDKSIKTVEGISNISGKVKHQKKSLLDELTKDSVTVNAIQKKIKTSQEMNDIFGKKPFNKNSLVKNLSIAQSLTKSMENELSSSVASLPKDEQRASLEEGVKQITEQNKSLVLLDKELSNYIQDKKVKTVPTSDVYKKLNKEVTNLKNEKLRQTYETQLSLLEKEVLKNDPTILNDDKKVALTFDDGPNNTSSQQILDILKKYNIKATFFMLGSMVDNYPDMVKKIHDAGNEIGNHTYDHKDLIKLDDASIKQEIESTNQKIEKITGERPTLLRPPYGSYNERVTRIEPDMKIALWNIDTLDWKTHNPTAILGEVKKELQPHSIVLMHDIHQESADSLENVIKFLKSQDYTFVLANELIN
ncbi:polysaccharide deacetylase family protein [Vagococcus sp. JNUCC 83]